MEKNKHKRARRGAYVSICILLTSFVLFFPLKVRLRMHIVHNLRCQLSHLGRPSTAHKLFYLHTHTPEHEICVAHISRLAF